MKVTATRKKKDFKPIDLTLTLESEDQLNAIYSLFNHESIRKFLEPHGIKNGDVRTALERAAGIKPDYHVAFEILIVELKK